MPLLLPVLENSERVGERNVEDVNKAVAVAPASQCASITFLASLLWTNESRIYVLGSLLIPFVLGFLVEIIWKASQ